MMISNIWENIWENKKCSKPPTRFCNSPSLLWISTFKCLEIGDPCQPLHSNTCHQNSNLGVHGKMTQHTVNENDDKYILQHLSKPGGTTFLLWITCFPGLTTWLSFKNSSKPWCLQKITWTATFVCSNMLKSSWNHQHPSNYWFQSFDGSS